MNEIQRTIRLAALAGAVSVLAGCGGGDADRDATVVRDDGAAQTAPQPEAPPPPPPDLRLEVDVSARELYVYRNDERIATHGVAVGTAEWPTRTGEWTIGQVVWNPRWEPPTDESWAEEEETKEPGDPENPLGRAQLVYDAPRSIHGTNEPASIGTAASHGSLRVTNDVAVELARMVMDAGGASRDEEFYRRVRDNPTEREDVPIPNPVPIRVVD
jgi:hypothetical protein